MACSLPSQPEGQVAHWSTRSFPAEAGSAAKRSMIAPVWSWSGH